MNINLFNPSLISKYKSNSQIARVLTENWYVQNMYCPSCLNKSIIQFKNNNKASDFFCENCKNRFESKSSSKKFGKKVNDGQYDTMINAINSDNSPNFFLMHYSRDDWNVKNLSLIPNFFMTSSIIEKRNALRDTADRNGWVGCTILIRDIPEEGKIFVIKDEKEINRERVNKTYKKMIFLKSKDPKFRGWTLDVLRCVQELDKEKFRLNEVYSFEEKLRKLHPDNKHIKDKIRQQLQVLRDNNILEFTQKGIYFMKG